MTGTVLILGASGRFGRNAAEAFWNAGWSVRTFDRNTDTLPEAAGGVDVIVNAWNPPYTDWTHDVPRSTQAVIDTAKVTGATVIVPGNVYVFGGDAPQRLAEDTPHAATNPLGRVRAAMEAAYRNAGVRTIVLRAGDFLDTEASGNWFDRIMVRDIMKGKLVYPGPADRPHAWAFLPDLARAAVTLAEMRADLPAFTDVPFPGYTLTGEELRAACETALGRRVGLKRMSWLPLWLLTPIWPMGRKLIEMRYLWSKPHHLARSRFDALLPDFRETPVEEAIAAALWPNIHPDKSVARGQGGGVVAAE